MEPAVKQTYDLMDTVDEPAEVKVPEKVGGGRTAATSGWMWMESECYTNLQS